MSDKALGKRPERPSRMSAARSRHLPVAAVAARPVSIFAAEALNSAVTAMAAATEAMKSVSEALYRTETGDGAEPGSPDWVRPISDLTGLTFVSPSQIHTNRSSLSEAEKTPVNNLQKIVSNSSQDSQRQSKAVSHVDLMDAVSKLKNSQDNPTKAHAAIARPNRYGEDVADKNIGGLYTDSNPESCEPTLIPRPGTPHEVPPGMLSTLHETLVILTICMAHFLTQAGLSQVIAPLHIVGSSFSSTTNKPSLSWYAAAFSLTVGTFILPSGRLGDVFGHKLLFIIGWLWYALFSLLAGFAPKLQAAGAQGEAYFVVCRAMQGIGPALLMPNALAILGRTYPPGNKKNMVFAMFGASAPAGFVIGAAMASLFAEKVSWSWAFWGLAVTCFFMALISLVVIPTQPAHDTRLFQAAERAPLWARLDLPGTVLGVSALILINVALNQAPLVSWSTPYTYFILLLGLLLLAFFLFVEFHPALSPYSLLPRAALSLETTFVLICTAAGWSAFGIWVFYAWDFLEALRLSSPLSAAAQFAPAPISGLVASICTGMLLSKTTPRVIMLLSMVAFFAGTTIMAFAPVQQVYWKQVFLSVLIMPFGMDLSFPSATILLSNKVGHEHQGMAASLVNTVVNYSISVGLGLAGTVQRAEGGEGVEGILKGIRSALYLGMGLSGAGIGVAVLFVVLGSLRNRGVTDDEKIEGQA